MSTSGTTSFNETRDTIITNALQLLNVVGAGESATTNDITFCASILNQMVKAWMAQGIHLWTEEEGAIFFINGQAKYNLPGANASDGSGTPVETSLSSTAGSGTTSIVCTTVTGMSVSDNIGIQQDNNIVLWTTISAINTGTNTVTLNSGLTNQASIGDQVFTYTTALGRPISIQSVRIRNNSNFDRYIKIIPRQDYDMIPQKALSGDPVVAYYTPQMSTGSIFFWPTPNDVSKRAEITYLRTIQDFDASTDNADFPQEWLECLVYNLAVRIAPAYGVTMTSGGIQGLPDILRMANQFLEELKAWDAEQPYIKIIPNYTNYRYTNKS